MRTKKSILCQATCNLVWRVMAPLFVLTLLGATHTTGLAATEARPLQSDRASEQLIQNYLTVTGLQKAQSPLLNLVARGTIKESTLLRNFILIETADGKRHLTYHWTHLGRDHRVVFAYDGLQTWTQVLAPQQQEAQAYSGINSKHFASYRWLMQPFTLPTSADYVFQYKGNAKVGGRPAHAIKAYGKNNSPSWFYFDKDKSLLTRWGGLGELAGTQVELDYQATQFKPVDGILLPSQIELLAENAIYGRIKLEQISINQDLNDFSFYMPQLHSPTLRQRPTVKD
ncbi:hypothetical protein SH580_20300 [Coraliomargarita algicola]|uniref:Outer membrane lipoprotein-sorting protein n=1 Tax=Coraliomargarita algicola TaxID=3092156 RepID=A0ABZ0RLW0_9BACT|nr:hypothetical protein [Coraliomargarita sp. J2-16]WPJ95765.1 hypothetical protein SH580_20300 [Coraliomargarita sp. J2-16]